MRFPTLTALLFAAALACSATGFAPPVATANDDAWDDRFGAPGVTCCAGYDKVFAVEAVGNDVYVAGEFTSLGNLDGTQGIGRWDGRRWHSLAGGLRRDGDRTGIVNALAVGGDDLYVVGSFDKAGSVVANGIARWNIPTQTWHAVGSGIGPQDEFNEPTSAAAVAVVAGEVYIGGGFDSVDGVAASRVAVWNGTSWAPLAGGVADEVAPGRESVDAIVGAGDTVYVAGEFELAVNPVGVADVRANNIAAWNRATKRWSGLGTGASARVYALALDGNALYAGGAFKNAGGKPVNGVARWGGGQWQPPGSGVTGEVYSLRAAGGSVYAAGAFGAAGGVQPKELPNAGLYVAGGILEAGCKPSVGFAIYRDVGARAAPQVVRAFLPFVQK